MTKICVVTCYKQPDYVRGVVLRAALARLPNTTVIIVKNQHTGLLRYPEVIGKIIKARIQHKPDVYILTFRGYELLPFFLLLTIGKKRIFDELVNFVEWVAYEHKKLRAGSLLARVVWVGYRWLLKQCDVVLCDTELHRRYVAELMHLPLSKFYTVPVSTDEEMFKPKPTTKQNTFQVFHYGNMLPLHGLQYILDAAIQLRDNPRITFLLAGGKADVTIAIEHAVQQGAHIIYIPWIPYKDLPSMIARSSMCLAGPFGGTLQAGMVITGKAYQFLAMGVPTLIGCIDELSVFQDRKNCLLVPQANAVALATQITWAEQHPKELAVIGIAGRQMYMKYYANDTVTKLLADMLQRLS
jgi:glycosyltransferase involved in cell wall biosynthesis